MPALVTQMSTRALNNRRGHSRYRTDHQSGQRNGRAHSTSRRKRDTIELFVYFCSTTSTATKVIAKDWSVITRIKQGKLRGPGMADRHQTPLIHATIGGYEDVVSSLLAHGARIGNLDTQRRSALHWAVVHRREGLLRLLLKHCAGDRAVLDGYDDSCKTPLHTAIDTGFEAGVQMLLEFGANIHYKAGVP